MIIAFCNGGDLSYENVRTVCRHCAGRKTHEIDAVGTLTRATVDQIRALWPTGVDTYEMLGKKFGVSADCVMQVVRYWRWKDCDCPSERACVHSPAPMTNTEYWTRMKATGWQPKPSYALTVAAVAKAATNRAEKAVKKAEVIADRHSGMFVRDVARKHQVSAQTVLRWAGAMPRPARRKFKFVAPVSYARLRIEKCIPGSNPGPGSNLEARQAAMRSRVLAAKAAKAGR
jgi:hypothetical protein